MEELQRIFFFFFFLMQASVVSAELHETMVCELDKSSTELQMALSLGGLLPPSGHELIL